MSDFDVTRFSRAIVATGAALALFAVVAGAFAAHGLAATLPARSLAVFETAARYQMYHALALLVVGLLALAPQLSASLLRLAAVAFLLGMVLFCGSLYLLALTGIGWLGAVTPLGGVAFLLGWAAIVLATLKRPETRD